MNNTVFIELTNIDNDSRPELIQVSYIISMRPDYATGTYINISEISEYIHVAESYGSIKERLANISPIFNLSTHDESEENRLLHTTFLCCVCGERFPNGAGRIGKGRGYCHKCYVLCPVCGMMPDEHPVDGCPSRWMKEIKGFVKEGA
jgi:hypothetical protein